jgi:CRISPR-associated protein Cas5d
MKVERVSYDVMTPSAARGILEAIYWKPQMRWLIDSIHVLKPIRFTNLRRNELGKRGPSARTLSPFISGKKSSPVAQYVEDDRQQRASTILQDVDYLIRAHLELVDERDPVKKHFEMFKRRATRGQCFQQPYLGCREFAAGFSWHDGPDPQFCPELQGTRDLGWMLHDIDFTAENTPGFFHATMRNGIIRVPSFDSDEVRR